MAQGQSKKKKASAAKKTQKKALGPKKGGKYSKICRIAENSGLVGDSRVVTEVTHDAAYKIYRPFRSNVPICTIEILITNFFITDLFCRKQVRDQ